MIKTSQRRARGFTLLELIIVIAILSVLSVAVVLVINPAETLRKGRDSTRLSDLAALKSAVSLYTIDASPVLLDNDAAVDRCATTTYISVLAGIGGVTDEIIGGSSVVFDTPLANLSLTNGTGWLPVNLGNISGGTPLSNMPLDPVNNAVQPATTGCVASTLALVTECALTYVYRCSDLTTPSFEINAQLESVQYSQIVGGDDYEGNDGGNNANVFESGTSLTLIGVY